MPIIRGPFNLTWGNNTLEDVEEINVDYAQDEEDYQTVQYQTRIVDGPVKVSVTITLLQTDVASLAAVLPQFHKTGGDTASTGETIVSDGTIGTDGMIDVALQDCTDEIVYNDLDIESCGAPGQVTRLVNARTKLDDMEFDGKIQKVMVKFVGEAGDEEASLQFFNQGALGTTT